MVTNVFLFDQLVAHCTTMLSLTRPAQLPLMLLMITDNSRDDVTRCTVSELLSFAFHTLLYFVLIYSF